MWDISGKQLTVLKGHSNGILSASFSQDSQNIVTASFDNTARLWNIRDKQLTQLVGHSNGISSASFSRKPKT
nr:hypothetical protein [Dulcicalothrix desertica]